ncbi:Neurogenic locus Notch protein [Diplonema papillatum]|nr:Neurogenic locus Notch protein [Diplonema papillatum]
MLRGALRRVLLAAAACAAVSRAANECPGVTVCTNGGQQCFDPNPNVAGDWECRCVGSASGSKVGGQATCGYLGECDSQSGGSTCSAFNKQACLDPNVTVSGDWQCICVPPMSTTTPGTAGTAAACELDECLDEAKSSICTDAGQTCDDSARGVSDLDDFTCSCVAPATGSATAGKAVCVGVGECATNSTCAAAGQSCDDPDVNAAGDFVCSCIAPLTGTGTAAPASCSVDECAERCGTCADTGAGNACTVQGSLCIDPDAAVLGDWYCELDECTANAATCVGQTCDDPVKTVVSLNDWTCSCVLPQVGSAPVALATCTLDECTDAAKASICTNGGQTCADPTSDPATVGDWTCDCVAPATGSEKAALATCTFPGLCDGGNATICQNAGQVCEENVALATFHCACLPPSTGDKGDAAPATCELDECTQVCATCADAGNGLGSACAASGGGCVDQNNGSQSTADWYCTTEAPATDVPASPVPDTQVPSAAPDSAVPATTTAPATSPAPDTSIPDTEAPSPIPNTEAPSPIPDTEAPSPIPDTVAPSPVPGASSAPDTDAPKGSSADECTDPAKAGMCPSGQSCQDGDQTVSDDWQCVCDPPASGSATAAPAACGVDECAANLATCVVAGQTCTDPNQTLAGDWTCDCVAPAVGSSVAGQPATCAQVGECVSNQAACIAANQSCSDLNPGVVDDWTCDCVAPWSGTPGVMAPATCTLDECLVHGAVCTNAGQVCSDPNKVAFDNWLCKCVAPFGGTGAAQPAVCLPIEDECATKTVCTAANQTCADPNEFIDDDFICGCKPPRRGTGTGAVAVCEEDECLGVGRLCASAGQRCEDADPTTSGDWTCSCIAPATGNPGTRSTAICVQKGECGANLATCAAAKQSCDDPDPAVTGDWTCNCIAPENGTSVQGAPATCTFEECTVHGSVCTAVLQTCDDPDPSKIGDWTCSCVLPDVGVGQQREAVCTRGEDECVLNSATCINAGQECLDPNQAMGGDWLCMCPAPADGSQGQAVATCTIDECIANGQVCFTGGQRCEDPDQTVVGDWTCNCVLPSTGTAVVGAAATCTEVGECVAQQALCASHNQSCSDPDPNTNNDWTCECIAPYAGSAAALGPADCELNECMTHGSICSNAGQTCSDPSELALGDWRCSCPSPHGSVFATADRAACPPNPDECSTHGALCTAVGQRCRDLDLQVFGNWVCECVPPATGSGDRMPANCTQVGDCTASSRVCTAAGQSCDDPDPATPGDWTCNCVLPLTGSGNQSVAACTADECRSNGDVCTVEGQRCTDPDPSPQSFGDWQCECVAPSIGPPRVASAAQCSVTSECSQAHVNQTCTSVGQSCYDPDFNILDNWICTCPAPSNGTSLGKAARCYLDECVANRDVCAKQGQGCLDADPNSLSSGDWVCFCVEPAVGKSVEGKAAKCTEVGECVANAALCKAAGQSCNDPNPNVAGDWFCECILPAEGTVGRTATCGLSECFENESVCSAAAQRCNDPNIMKPGDWSCTCISPLSGTEVGKPASCGTDECLTDGIVCSEQGQTCDDPDVSIAGNWACTCAGSGAGTAAGAPVNCTWTGECAVEANRQVCTGFGQTCADPNPAKDGDWTCACVAPQKGTPGLKKRASCDDSNAPPPPLNECTVNKQTCNAVGQDCFDPDSSASAANDWMCNCLGSSTGTETAGAANCTFTDSCAPASIHLQCVNAGQTCVSNGTGFTCQCVGGLLGEADGKVASCADPDAPVQEGAGCSWGGETQCEADEDCFWSIDRGQCELKYCETRAPTCEDDPICQYNYAIQRCVRTPCGESTTPEDCGKNSATCEWFENVGGFLPLAQGPYDLSPQYCRVASSVDDNSQLLLWLIVIALALCLCLIGVAWLARILRRKLHEKEQMRRVEEEMQEKLLMPERELAEARRLEMQARDIAQDLLKEPPMAVSLAAAKGMKDGYKKEEAAAKESDNPRDKKDQGSDEEEPEPASDEETDRALVLKEQLARLKLKNAEQHIQQKQREEARIFERKRRALERTMDAEENKKEKQRQLDRAKTSAALQYGVAQREASQRGRERKREQELLLEIEKTQSKTEQQTRRQLELGERHDELRDMGDDGTGREAFVGGDGLDEAKQRKKDKGVDALLHGDDGFDSDPEHGGGGGGGEQAPLPFYKSNAGMDHSPRSVFVVNPVSPRNQSVNSNDHVTIASPILEDTTFGASRKAAAQMSHADSASASHLGDDTRSRAGGGEARNGRLGGANVQAYYDSMVQNMVQDKLAADDTRSPAFDRPAGEVKPAARPKPATTAKQWNRVLSNIIKTSDATGTYSKAHARAPSLPASPETVHAVV